MAKKNVLVFPCGSEIALEIHRSLLHSTHFRLIGANSVDDHGKFVYQDYIDGVPFVTSPDFIPTIKRIIKEWQIDIVYDDTLIVEKKYYNTQLMQFIFQCKNKGKKITLLNSTFRAMNDKYCHKIVTDSI